MNDISTSQTECCLAEGRSRPPAQYDPGHYKIRAAVLKALAHPVRLFIVDCLEQREHCVCELTEHVGLDQSTISKHLSVLRNARIVDDEKRGRETWYSLRIPCVAGFFSCIEQSLAHSEVTSSSKRGNARGARR